MKETIEYEIYIGCRDSQTLNEVASLNEFRELPQVLMDLGFYK